MLPSDSAEPNDTPAQAKALSGRFTGTFNEGDAPDVFKFSATANQTVNLQLIQTPGSTGDYIAFRLNVVAPNGATTLTRDRMLDPYTQAEPLTFKAPVTGEYALTLEGFYAGPADSFCSLGRLNYQLSAGFVNP